MQITNISEAKASIYKLVEQVLNGQEVIIGKAGKPVAKLVPYTQDTSPRKLGAGQWKGKIWIADDFDKVTQQTWVVGPENVRLQIAPTLWEAC
jgi:prevent-host-death family protein